MITLLCAVLLALGGCAGTAQNAATAPDESLLAPAQKALAKAQNAHADDFAPRAIDAARRRITTARDILFAAARARRPLNPKEHERIGRLVAGAKLDARAALTQTQAQAVAVKVAQLQSQLSPRSTSPAQARPRAKKSVPSERPSPLNPQPESQRRPLMDRAPQNNRPAPLGPPRTPGTENNRLPGTAGPRGRTGRPMGPGHMGVP